MDRVNGNNTIDIGDGRRGFRSQNAAAGIAGTEVTDKILNDVQEEICAVIENAGLVLDPANQKQLWESLQLISAPGFANRVGWLPVISMSTIVPPNDAVIGDTYLIPAGATGVWAGNEQKLAEWNGSSWRIFATRDGHGISLPNGKVFLRLDGVYAEKLAIDAQSGKWNFAQAGGTPNAITGALVPAITDYTTGLEVQVKITENNSGPVTLDLGGGARPVTTPSGSPLQSADLSGGSVYSFIFNGVSWTVLIEGQRVLDGNITLFVRADGNDLNDGMTNNAGGAFRNIQRAIDVAQRRYVSASYVITIQVGNGAYSAFRLSGGASASIEVIGNVATPASVAVTATAGAVVTAATNSTLRVSGIRASGGTNVFVSLDRSNIEVSNVEVGACVNYQLYASNNSSISVNGDIACSGSARSMFCASSNGVINCSGRSVTFRNAVNFSVGTCFSNNGTVIFTGSTWTGAAFVTGSRYLANITGLIYTEGGGANFIPGSSAGSVTTGGLYL